MAIIIANQCWRTDCKADVCDAIQDPGLSSFGTHTAMMHGSRAEVCDRADDKYDMASSQEKEAANTKVLLLKATKLRSLRTRELTLPT